LNAVDDIIVQAARLGGSIVESGIRTFQMYELGPGACVSNQLFDTFQRMICNTIPSFCDLIYKATGFDRKVDNVYAEPEFKIRYNRHQPAGFSYQQLFHYMQLIQSDTPVFKAYDYGDPNENYDHYGIDIAPHYDLSEWKIPTI